MADDGRRSRSAARSSARCWAPARAGGRGRLHRSAGQRPVGRGAAEDGDDVAPELRLAAAQAARSRRAGDAAARLRAAGRRRIASTSPASRGWSARRARRSRRSGRSSYAKRSRSGGDRRSPTSRSRPLRSRRSGGWKSSGSRRSRPDRRRPRAWRRRRARRRARVTRRSVPAPRAASRSADARALPLGSPGRRAPGLPRRAPRARATSSGSNQGRRLASCTRRSSARTERSRAGTPQSRTPRTSSPTWSRAALWASRSCLGTGAAGGSAPDAAEIARRLAERFDCPPDHTDTRAGGRVRAPDPGRRAALRRAARDLRRRTRARPRARSSSPAWRGSSTSKVSRGRWSSRAHSTDARARACRRGRGAGRRLVRGARPKRRQVRPSAGHGTRRP